jgi:predicted SprT family Zn-dependent metalloprotease
MTMTLFEITQLFQQEAAKHGFGHVPIKTDRSRRRIGGCAYRGSEITYFTFSAILMPLMSDAEILDTIRHEIAHAKTPGNHHDHVWQAAAIAIGARPQPCADVTIDAKMAGFKYIAPCLCSAVKHGKTRRPTRSLICADCHQRLDFVQQY